MLPIWRICWRGPIVPSRIIDGSLTASVPGAFATPGAGGEGCSVRNYKFARSVPDAGLGGFFRARSRESEGRFRRSLTSMPSPVASSWPDPEPRASRSSPVRIEPRPACPPPRRPGGAWRGNGRRNRRPQAGRSPRLWFRPGRPGLAGSGPPRCAMVNLTGDVGIGNGPIVGGDPLGIVADVPVMEMLQGLRTWGFLAQRSLPGMEGVPPREHVWGSGRLYLAMRTIEERGGTL